jgi:Flp pilus assembly protein TadG
MNSTFGRLKSQRGAELIEMALILPLLLLVLVGIVDFGFLFQRYEVLTNAAREGARIAVLGQSGYTLADVRKRVCDYLQAGGVPTANPCTGVPGSNPGVVVNVVAIPMPGPPASTVNARQVVVTYTHNFMFIGPIIGMMGGSWTNTKTITIDATMRLEQ